jgi:CHRD domain
VSNIAPATAAHIHEAPVGKAGDAVVTLSPPPTEGSSKNCVNVDKDLIKRIRQNPENFYVNVHNADFPDGAIRGQLSK